MSQIHTIRGFALSAKVSSGPVSSLASMPVRNALLVQITDTDGVEGWGEAWCNFPPRGNLARLNLLEDVIGPAITGSSTSDPAGLCRKVSESALRMRLHTGEDGPYRHCLAAIDTALHDIAAHRAGLPLAHYLNPGLDPRSPVTAKVYASSPSGSDFADQIAALAGAGHSAVKLKVGYDFSSDLALLERFATLDSGLGLFIDANQAWSVPEACQNIPALAGFSPGFIEEPILANSPLTDWRTLADEVEVPLAAGENITALSEFEEKLSHGGLHIAQPDIAKWGGVSGAMRVAEAAARHGGSAFLHYMGSAIGLAASLHVMAAFTRKDQGEGYVELDANPNPLRSALAPLELNPKAGRLPCPTGPGIGVVPDPEALGRYTVASFTLSG